MSRWITLNSRDGRDVAAYVAEPQGRPKGGVVVLQEIFGVNGHIRSVADSWAAEGYWVIAPSTFHRVQPGVELGYVDSDMQTGFGFKTAVEALPAPGVMDDIQAAIDQAVATSAGKVGIVGYCWGGLLAWRSACQLQGLSAAVTYYGGGMTTADELGRQARCPVLAHFAEQDHWIALDTVLAFKARHPEVEVHTYNAHHGFNCDQRGSYDARAAQQALERTRAFFKAHLG
jgi:carboxymethylenebutenolidase